MVLRALLDSFRILCFPNTAGVPGTVDFSSRNSYKIVKTKENRPCERFDTHGADGSGAVVFFFPADAKKFTGPVMSVVGNEERSGALPIVAGIVNLIEVGSKATDSEIKLG